MNKKAKMPELIDKQASMRAICEGCFKSRAVDIELKCRGTCNVIDILQQQPTIEPEVRHGRWIEESTNEYYCSYCGKYAPLVKNMRHCDCSKWCKECGTKMDATDTNVGGKGGDDNDSE